MEEIICKLVGSEFTSYSFSLTRVIMSNHEVRLWISTAISGIGKTASSVSSW